LISITLQLTFISLRIEVSFFKIQYQLLSGWFSTICCQNTLASCRNNSKCSCFWKTLCYITRSWFL